jgi:hypothetical protein
MNSPMRRLAALCVSTFALAPLATADDATPICPAIDPPATAARPLMVRAFRDPVTGKLRPPTREELARLREAQALAPKEAPAFTTTVLPDGTTAVNLGDAFLFSVVATRQPDGTLRYECVPHGATNAAPGSTRPAHPEEK